MEFHPERRVTSNLAAFLADLVFKKSEFLFFLRFVSYLYIYLFLSILTNCFARLAY